MRSCNSTRTGFRSKVFVWAASVAGSLAFVPQYTSTGCHVGGVRFVGVIDETDGPNVKNSAVNAAGLVAIRDLDVRNGEYDGILPVRVKVMPSGSEDHPFVLKVDTPFVREAVNRHPDGAFYRGKCPEWVRSVGTVGDALGVRNGAPLKAEIAVLATKGEQYRADGVGKTHCTQTICENPRQIQRVSSAASATKRARP